MQASSKPAAHPPGTQQLNDPPTTNNGPEPKRTQSQLRGLNPRSCPTCRRRKVKCDKLEGGCSNCQKANIECVYPGPGYAPRRPKVPKPPGKGETELLKRMRRLEAVVEGLSEQLELEKAKASTASSSGDKNGDQDIDFEKRTWNSGMDQEGIKENPPKLNATEKEFGRLVIDEGKSRYVSSTSWASLNGEFDNISKLFEEYSLDACDSEESEDETFNPLLRIDGLGYQSFGNEFGSGDINLRSLYPLPSQIPFYLETFKENVDPLIKIFHIPTISKIMKEVKDRPGSLTKSIEALQFSIYYATITSMSAEEVKSNFGVDKISLLKRYRFGIEQALAKARYLNTSEIVTLQAFVLFIVCIRRSDNLRFIWTLTGVAIRIAQSLGLHRDGRNFGLTPFDTEVRRRLWWQIAILDVTTAEEYGTSPSIFEYSVDTHLPLNINDCDLDPSMTEAPTPRIGNTEMTFCLIRFEICNTSRKVLYTPLGPSTAANRLQLASLADKEDLVRQFYKRLEKDYLVYCENAGPLLWVAANVARLIVAKMGLIIYLGTPGVADKLLRSVKDRLFVAAVEIIEYSRLLEAEASTKKWGWLCHTYVQWYAVAYALNQIGTRPNSELVERAWRAVSDVFGDWDEAMERSKNNVLWVPMRRLMAKVAKKRENELSGIPSTTPSTSTSYPSSSVEELPSIKSPQASNSSNFPYLDPIRPLQNGPSPVMDRQMLNQGLESNLSQFYNQQLEQNDNFANLAADYQYDHLATSIPGMVATANGLDLDLGPDLGPDMNWDSFMKDFQMEIDVEQPDARGPSLGGVWF